MGIRGDIVGNLIIFVKTYVLCEEKWYEGSEDSEDYGSYKRKGSEGFR